MSVYLSICLSVCLSVCLPIYLSTYLPIHPSMCLSICLSVYQLINEIDKVRVFLYVSTYVYPIPSGSLLCATQPSYAEVEGTIIITRCTQRNLNRKILETYVL
jgi:hypothetical protein